MLKLALLGVWVILVTSAATYSSIYLKSPGESAADNLSEDQSVEEFKGEMISVPMIHGGQVIGYVIIQLSFEASKAVLAEKRLEPLPYLNDAAFRVIFSSSDIDFRRLRGGDLDRLTADIARSANARIGAELLRHVLIQQLNFVRKDDIRTNWIGGGAKQ